MAIRFFWFRGSPLAVELNVSEQIINEAKSISTPFQAKVKTRLAPNLNYVATYIFIV